VLFTFPSRYSFTIGQTGIFRLYPTVWADSHGIPRGPCYSGHTIRQERAFGYGAITLYGPGSNPVRLPRSHSPAGPIGDRTHAPTTPHTQRPTAITRMRFSHAPLSLATTHGISFPTGTEMFHFPAYPPRHKGGCRPIKAGGLPHSDTLGSKPA
jgi:hypothetical protein